MKALLAGVLCAVTCLAQNAVPPNGHKAPELELSQILQAPAATQPIFAALRGKAVVLEFWATWCGGCVAAIPHLNQLADQFKDKPVVFLSVTDENADVVQAFLKKRPMNSWVGIDKRGATFQKYGINGRPQAILIDTKGIVRASMFPDRLNAAVIDRLIAGQPIATDFRLKQPSTAPMELRNGVPPPLLQVLIRPAATSSVSGYAPGAVMRADGGRIEYFGVTLRTLLEYTEDLRDDRIIAPEWFDHSRYDASTAIPEGRSYDLRNALLQQMLTAAFQLKMHRETRPVSVFVLSGAPGVTGKMNESNAKPSQGFLSHPGQFTGVATSVSGLIHGLGRDLGGVEIVDETGLKGVYDFDLSWRKGDLESLRAALHDQLGLTLAKETRSREFLVVVMAVEPKTW